MYSALALFAWIVTCITNFRRITSRNYGYTPDQGSYHYGWTSSILVNNIYLSSENWLRAARVIQALVGVLRVPLSGSIPWLSMNYLSKLRFFIRFCSWRPDLGATTGISLPYLGTCHQAEENKKFGELVGSIGDAFDDEETKLRSLALGATTRLH